MTRVFVLGMSVLDHVFFMPDLPAGALKHRADGYTATIGGGATNAAAAIARLGGAARLAIRLGDDANAQAILDAVTAIGIEPDFCRRTPGAVTSVSSVIVAGDGERQIVNFRGSGFDEDISWLTRDALAGCDAVLVDTRLPAAATRALRLARDIGIPGVVDAEAPFDKAGDLLRTASHIALPAQGLRALVDAPDLPTGLAALRATYPDAWLSVTDGADGAYFTAGDGIAHTPALPVTSVDSLGAGDVWHGAFALALAEGRSEADAVAFAGAAAALKCRNGSGWAAYPSRADIAAALA